ncbi:hypothetical protein [Streptomyces sp. 11-1-2]|uniref:hypothetical protein n=1 Tax=Streptomyces sp. 11-1-2 TaxID=1851167 RepID=UPI001F08FD16|nr:hypothetical protein [Streptomyces sp. 11-1-2]
MRHALVVVLALTAYAVPAGATSLPAVSEWSADAPSAVLEHLGVRPAPLFASGVCLRKLAMRVNRRCLPGGYQWIQPSPQCGGCRRPIAADGWWNPYPRSSISLGASRSS